MGHTKISCASYPLQISTVYPGKNQVTHPSVISFPSKWNGYRYYMAYTPFPFADGAQENPCLCASNDLKNWETPSGLVNPIATCYETNCDELKDPELVYNEEKDQLEIWYLGRINSSMTEGGPLCLFRKTSKDAREWSQRELLYTFTGPRLVSPSVIYEKGVYRLWGIIIDNKPRSLYYMDSADGGQSWTPLAPCEVSNGTDTAMWHCGITKHDDRYYYVWYGQGSFDGIKPYGGAIYVAESSDGIFFSKTRPIIQNSRDWDHLYRPSLVIEDDTFYCFYGVTTNENAWYVALSTGADIDSLEGYNDSLFVPPVICRSLSERLTSYMVANLSYKSSLFYVLGFVIFLLGYNLVISIFLSAFLHFLYMMYKHERKMVGKLLVSGTLFFALLSFCYLFVINLFSLV